MNELKIFEFKTEQVRILDFDGEPWFVAKDVCDVLGLENITEALRGLEDDELTSGILNSGGQDREMKIINEPGLYSLVLRSRKPEAKKFKRWITHDVLPAIRKHGEYAVNTQKSQDLLKLIETAKGSISVQMMDSIVAEAAYLITGEAFDVSESSQVFGGKGTGSTVNKASTILYSFFQDNPSNGERISSSDLYRELNAWCKAKGIATPSQNAIGRALRQNGCESYKSKCDRFWVV